MVIESLGIGPKGRCALIRGCALIIFNTVKVLYLLAAALAASMLELGTIVVILYLLAAALAASMLELGTIVVADRRLASLMIQ